MFKLNITQGVLDKLGFSEYWDENGTWGGRTLTFSNGTRFRIIEQLEMEDENEGYGALSGSQPKYIANYFYFVGWFALPPTKAKSYDLFFLHEMYECIEKEYPDCVDEFVDICKKANMKPYIDSYLEERENESKKSN